MPLQLSIRDNRCAADFGYTAHQNYVFENVPVSVGGSDCDCRVEDAEGAELFFRIEEGKGDISYVVVPPQSGTNVYVNNQAVSGPAVIKNGDEIRVNHWTFRFFRIHSSVGFSRRADALAMCAKILVALIFVGEIAFGVWLPHQLKAAQLWQKQIAEQKTVNLLERLKSRVRPESAADKLSRSGQRLIEKSIEKKTAYIRKNRDRLDADDWERLRKDLITCNDLLRRIKRGEAWQSSPSVNLEEGVEAVIEGNEEVEPMFSEPEIRDTE